MSIVQEFLKQKDSDYSKYIPAGYKAVAEEKDKVNFVVNSKAKYSLDTAGSCIKPCFKNFNTGMVSESESECMTNCVAKSMETLSLL